MSETESKNKIKNIFSRIYGYRGKSIAKSNRLRDIRHTVFNETNIMDKYKAFDDFKYSKDFEETKKIIANKSGVGLNKIGDSAIKKTFIAESFKGQKLHATISSLGGDLKEFGKNLSFHPFRAASILKTNKITYSEFKNMSNEMKTLLGGEAKIFGGIEGRITDKTVGKVLFSDRAYGALKSFAGKGSFTKLAIGFDTYLDVNSGKYSVPGAVAKSITSWGAFDVGMSLGRSATVAAGISEASILTGAGFASFTIPTALAMGVMETASFISDDTSMFRGIKKEREMKKDNYYKNWFKGQQFENRAMLTTRQRALHKMQNSYMSARQFVLGNEATLLSVM